MKLNGAEIIIQLLQRQGILTVAGIPGGANLPLYNALHKSSIRHILARHEQSAGFIAQGMARSTGQPAVCFATSGPGATNLLTSIADAKLDSVPVIAITGQVPASLIGTDAFQEVDTYGMSLPVTKHNFMARDAKELLWMIPEAFRLAQSGRPGPVWIDVPKDVQTQVIEFDAWPSCGGKDPAPPIGPDDLRVVAEMIHASRRPVLYIGGGIIQGEASQDIRMLAKKNSIPVASTLMGLGCFPPGDRLSLGMLGMHGARYTNYILREADLLLAFGVRFDDRAIGLARHFCPEARIVHIDIDSSEINKIKSAHCAFVADIAQALTKLVPLIRHDDRQEWIKRVDALRKEFPLCPTSMEHSFQPGRLIRTMSARLPKDTIVTTDVGQHQMWAAQMYPFQRPRSLLTSGGLGTMGFGLPAAIGAALAYPQRKTVCLTGDGSLLMNIQELATLAEWQLDVTILIFNNEHLGLVRQQQELFYNKTFIASRFEHAPDFAAIGRGFGIRSFDLPAEEDPLPLLNDILLRPGPCLVNIPIHYSENVFPMVPPGAANHEMIGG